MSASYRLRVRELEMERAANQRLRLAVIKLAKGLLLADQNGKAERADRILACKTLGLPTRQNAGWMALAS